MTREVLFVHDDQEGPLARRQVLELAGYKVRLLQRAERALAALERGLPALVLCDVLIHGATGFELCERIRARHPAEELPVLLTSVLYREAEHRAEAARVGAQGYLLRPIDPPELLREVHRLTRGRGAARRPA